ncbi:SGNH/GDSL hydrolase family protein [Streptomyces sp. NPDC051940]|uniref:SGNH/GDSL hydrolase family protein n=1 Tax=Streptomyces sp. NPDC051940 TaxID=3155675 RepID=UPI00341F01A2
MRPSVAGPAPGGSAVPGAAGLWTGTWAAAPAAGEPGTRRGLAGWSIRNVVHTTAGGTRVRIQLSNAFGSGPLLITHASISVARPGSGPAAVPGTVLRLTFRRATAVTIPAGQSAVSDDVPLAVPADRDLLVTTYSPRPSGSVTYHPRARQTGYAALGDHAADASGAAYTEKVPYWRYLTGVDVLSTWARGSVAVIGDSLTAGTSSTPGANHRWTDFLARRLRTEPGAPRYGVLNLGLSGNQLLRDGARSGQRALTRLDRDVLDRAGVRSVVVQLGVNDILRPPHQTDPARIAAALRALTAAAHERGLRVTGATLMPFAGHRRHTPELERVRAEVNRLVRAGGVFDEVVDFDRAVRDPLRPDRLLPAYDSGDHLHPSDAGYRAMARAVGLEQLRGTTRPQT